MTRPPKSGVKPKRAAAKAKAKPPRAPAKAKAAVKTKPAPVRKRPAVMTGADLPAFPWPPEPARVAVVFDRLAAALPEPKTELTYRNAFTLVVAVALSAQATDVSVNRATEKLFAVASTPRAMLDLGEAGLIPLIASIGLYRGKARNVIALSRQVIEEHGGEVPLTREGLQALPGVGRKTASVVLNELGVEAAVAVDTHVFRVSHRLGLADASTPDRVEDQLHRVIPPDRLGLAHHWLILHGRYTCTARKPDCLRCVVADLCPARPLLEAAGAVRPRGPDPASPPPRPSAPTPLAPPE